MSHKAVTLEMARAAKRQALELLATLHTTASVGITQIDGGYGLKVGLPEPLADHAELPAAIDDVPLVVEVVGRIKKQ